MWQRIRTFGELQILTRASYLMLLFVPILAGVWPAVRVAVNGYNDAVTHSRTVLEAAADRIEFAASTAESAPDTPSRVSEILTKVNTQLDDVIKDYAPKTIENSKLPSVWALAFLASLSVTIAHLIYQALAPVLIRQMTIREFIGSEVRRFVESPSEGQLERAQRLARGSRRWSEEKSGDEREKISPIVSVDAQNEATRRREIAIIEDAAAGEYRRLAVSNAPAALTSGVFYLIGLALIGWIMVTQTIKVISAAWGA